MDDIQVCLQRKLLEVLEEAGGFVNDAALEKLDELIELVVDASGGDLVIPE